MKDVSLSFNYDTAVLCTLPLSALFNNRTISFAMLYPNFVSDNFKYLQNIYNRLKGILIINNKLNKMTKQHNKSKTKPNTTCKWYPVCPMRRFYEEGKLDKKWIELYCKGNWKSCVRYQMEERGEYHPDWMLPDGTIDERLKE